MVPGQPVRHLGEGGVVGAVDDSQRLRALLRFAPCRDHPDQHIAGRRGDGRSGSGRGLRPTFVDVGLVAPFNGVQCVVNSKLHHRHGPADDDGVLAAGGRRLETGNVPVEDLVGRGLARRSKANQRKQPEHTGRHLGESSRAVSDESIDHAVAGARILNKIAPSRRPPSKMTRKCRARRIVRTNDIGHEPGLADPTGSTTATARTAAKIEHEFLLPRAARHASMLLSGLAIELRSRRTWLAGSTYYPVR